MSVYADTQAVTHDAAHQLDVRRKSLSDDLRRLGADQATADAVTEALAFGNGAQMQALVGAHGTVLLDQHVPGTLAEVVRWAPLPDVLPLLAVAQSDLPHVVVLADRTGADVLAYAGGGLPARTVTVAGSHDQIERNDPGGWSQRRYQDRAEDSWAGNAKEVADEVAKVTADLRAQLVLLNGDVRAVQLLQQYLPEAVQPLVEVIDAGGGRAVDGSAELVAEEVRARVATRAEADTAAVLEKFREERGQQDQAADGVRATVAALTQAKVGTLLLPDDDAGERRTAWFGPEPTHVALDPQVLTDLGVAAPVEGRLVDVLIRAALGTSADVRVLPRDVTDGPADGIGAILRW